LRQSKEKDPQNQAAVDDRPSRVAESCAFRVTSRGPSVLVGEAMSFPLIRVLAVALGCTTTAFALITPSSRDDFSASSEGWKIGSVGVQPVRVTAAGPDGQIGYLSHFSDGGGSNGKWLMWSDESKWQGDYLAAGVTGINLWANVSSGSSPVSMRIAFDGPGGWFYSSAQSVGAGWASYSFDLTQANFTFASGSGSGVFLDTFSGVTRFEILAGTGGVAWRAVGDILAPGTSVNTILLDDISAVPEPSTCALLLMTGAAACWWIRRRAKALGVAEKKMRP
jgi:hypothetical protein